MYIFRIISFGKVDWNYTGRKNHEVTLEVILRDLEGKPDRPELSIVANVWNTKHTDIVCGGQCLDSLVPYFKKNDLFNELYSYWQEYHLNGMHSGTPRQESILKDCPSKDYYDRRQFLKDHHAYVDEYNGELYEYGSSWVYHSIPQEVLDRLTEIIKM